MDAQNGLLAVCAVVARKAAGLVRSLTLNRVAPGIERCLAGAGLPLMMMALNVAISAGLAHGQGVEWTQAVIPDLRSHAMACDSRRGVAVLQGAYTGTWEWDGSAWSHRTSDGPPATQGALMTYDAGRGVVVWFNGSTWEWNGASWTRQLVAGPTTSGVGAMTFDSVRNVTALFWSTQSTGMECWEWDGVAWSRRSVGGPGSRFGFQVAFDPVRRVTVLFGGEGGGLQMLGDTWEWDGVNWVQRAVAGPPGRSRHLMAYDPRRGGVILFGGEVDNGGPSGTPFGDTWEWDGVSWAQLSVGAPSARYASAMAYDTGRGGVVLYGGDAGGVALGDTWELTDSGWVQQNPGGPGVRSGSAMAYDSDRQVSVLFGGSLNADARTWEWNGVTWVQRAALGPQARSNSTMSYDSWRHVAVLFGGGFGDTWEWDGDAWTQRATNGPSARSFTTMVFDSLRGVTVLFGGTAANGSGLGDTYEWDGRSWSLRATTGPSPRGSHGMAFDSRRGVTVLYGGYNGHASPSTFGDTWEWNGHAWTQRSVPGPGARLAHQMTFDSQRGVTVVRGGEASSPPWVTWEWDGIQWAQSTSTGPPGRHGAGFAYDAARGQMVMYGGFDNDYQDDTWTLQGACAVPWIFSQPESRIVCGDNTANFSVGASGSGTLSYLWQIESPPGVWQTLGFDPAELACGGFAYVTRPTSSQTTVVVGPCPGVHRYQIRAVVSDLCASLPSNPATLTLSSPDFDGDGQDGTDADIEAFFACIAGRCCPACGSADFDGDGDVATDADIESFFRVLAGGPC